MARLAGEPALNFYELACVIAELHDLVPSMQPLVYDSGIGRRRFYYLLKVGQFLRNWEIDKAAAEEIGWTKLQVVADHVERTAERDIQTVKDCLFIAKANTVRALPSALAGQKTVETRSVVFHLNPGGKAMLDEALVAFGAIKTHRGLIDKERALSRIILSAMKAEGHLD